MREDKSGQSKAFTSRKKIALAFCVLAAAGAFTAGGVLLSGRIRPVNAASESSAYRTYTVQKGDITVGLSESGTLSLSRNTVTLPVTATVTKVYVKSGMQVAEGDALFQVDPSDIEAAIASCQTAVDQAKLALSQAQLNYTMGQTSAKLAYQSSLFGGEYADIKESLTVQKLEQELSDAQENLEDLKEQLAELKALQISYPADALKLEQMKGWVDSSASLLEDYKTEQSYFTSQTGASELVSTLNKAKSALSSASDKTASAREAMEQAQDESGVDSDAYKQAKVQYESALKEESAAETSYESARAAYEDYTGKYGTSVEDGLSELESKIALVTAELKNYQTAYNNFKETFDETYSVTGDALDEKVVSLQKQIVSGQENLDNLLKTYDKSVLEASQQKSNDLSQADTALSEYNNTLEKLSQALQTAQNTYDQAIEDFEALQESLSSDGLVKSAYSGTVTSVSCYEDGEAAPNQTLVSISDSTEASLSLSVSEEDITALTVGQEASVSLSAYEGTTFDASIDSISVEPARSTASVSYTVTVLLDAPDQSLLLYEGMSGEITLIQKQVKDICYLQNQALLYEDGQSYVLLKGTDGNPLKTEVSTGFSDGRYVEIVEGLAKGDTVLVESAVNAG